MEKKIELLSPAGGMANLKAAVSRKADAVYLGMRRFSARGLATNFNESYLKETVRICKSNNVKIYLAMNTIVKNSEINDFFSQLSYAYSRGIDAVIIQEVSFQDIIRKNYPDIKIHISTQAGAMNSEQLALLSDADRVTLARELTKNEIRGIRARFNKEIEVFCHGALCASVSGMCLFSSLLGGRSGNRGLCAQPCRKRYDNSYLLSTKELCLIDKIPEMIECGINSLKIEGRMRTPYYVATATEVYRKAIDSYYSGKFIVTKDMREKLHSAFSRSFTGGWFSNSNEIFNREDASGKTGQKKLEYYNVKVNGFKPNRGLVNAVLPRITDIGSEKMLLAKVYSSEDAINASESGADIVYLDLFQSDINGLRKKVRCKIFGATPRIMLDSDIPKILQLIKEKKPDGILAGNTGMLNLGLSLPVHMDYSSNAFNDFDVAYAVNKGAIPIISPELSIKELKQFSNKNFAVLVHGKIALMTLRHNLPEGDIIDLKGERFQINNIHNGAEIINGKELGMLGKSLQLRDEGINTFFIDTDRDVARIVELYRRVLDGGKIDDTNLKKDYILGWSYRGAA